MESLADRAARYRAGAERLRAARPELADWLAGQAGQVEEEARHESHTVEFRHGGTWCSCGKPLGVAAVVAVDGQ